MIDIETQIGNFQHHTNVSRETIDRLKIYHDLLQKWNPAINLVSRNTLGEIWHRHFLDSAQLWKLCPAKAKIWMDIGSGAGFPGLVIAILAAGENSDLLVEMVESDARKAAFLLNTSQKLGLRTKIHTARIEELESKPVDVVSARALASLGNLFGYSEPFMHKNTVLLFQKGKTIELELTGAQKYWTFDLQKTPSITDPEGVILEIEGLGRV